MLKERRNQGTIALLVISLIFLVVAAVMGFIQYQKVNTKTAYDRKYQRFTKMRANKGRKKTPGGQRRWNSQKKR